MGSPRDYTEVFTGLAERPIQARGRYIRIMEATGDVYISVAGSSRLKRVVGQEIDHGSEFSRFILRSTIAQTVRVVVSDTSQRDDQQTVNVNATATVAPGNTLDAGGDVLIPANSAANVIAGDGTRLVVGVHNISDQELRIGGAGVTAASGLPLKPGEEKYIATTAVVAVFNPHATEAKSVAVLPLREV